MNDAPLFASLTDSPDRPICFKVNPLLFPGATEPIYVGMGPTADIRLEHIQAASVTSKTGTPISGKSLFRMARGVKHMLWLAEPLVGQCLGPDRSYLSGSATLKIFSRGLPQ